MKWVLVAAMIAGLGPQLPTTPVAAPRARALESTQWVMGTALRIVVEPGASASRVQLEPLFALASLWDQWLSNYRDDSVVAELQREAGHTLAVPEPLLDYFERSRLDHLRTEGRFDILHASHLPTDAWDGLSLSRVAGRSYVGLGQGLVVDPGGNGKGFAVQAILDTLRSWSVRRALIDFGGSSWAAVGSPRSAEAWQIEVEDAGGVLLGWVALRDASLSISQTRLRGAQTRRHVFDPEDESLVEVERTALVRSPDAIDAEVLSTTLIVGGRDALGVISRYPGAEAVLVEAGGVFRSGPCTWFTPAD